MINAITTMAIIMGILMLFVIAVVFLVFVWACIKIWHDMRYDEQQVKKYNGNE